MAKKGFVEITKELREQLLLKRKDMSVQQLSKDTGIGASVLYLIFKGEQKSIQAGTHRKVLQVLSGKPSGTRTGLAKADSSGAAFQFTLYLSPKQLTHLLNHCCNDNLSPAKWVQAIVEKHL